MRRISSLELEFLRRAIESGRGALDAGHLESALAIDVHPEDPDFHHIQLAYPDGTKIGKRWTPIAEWFACDADGASIEILAFADEHGRLQELQMHRTDTHGMKCLPTIAMAKLVSHEARP